jgi:hypothetical protein
VDCLWSQARGRRGERRPDPFARLAAQYTLAAPLILEYVAQADCKQALAQLRTTFRQIRVGKK